MTTKGKDCLYEGEIYPHGTEICWVDSCMVCKDGELEIPVETTGGGEFQVDAAEAYFSPVPRSD